MCLRWVNDGLVWGATHGENPLKVVGRSLGVELRLLPWQRLGYSQVSRVPLPLKKKYTREHPKKRQTEKHKEFEKRDQSLQNYRTNVADETYTTQTTLRKTIQQEKKVVLYVYTYSISSNDTYPQHPAGSPSKMQPRIPLPFFCCCPLLTFRFQRDVLVHQMWVGMARDISAVWKHLGAFLLRQEHQESSSPPWNCKIVSWEDTIICFQIGYIIAQYMKGMTYKTVQCFWLCKKAMSLTTI